MKFCKLLLLSILLMFSMIISTAVFAEGGKINYPFSFNNPAAMARTHKFKAEGGLSVAFVDVPFRGGTVTNAVATYNNLNENSNTRYYLPGFNISYRFNKHLLAGLIFGEPYYTSFYYAPTSGLQYSIVTVRQTAYNIAPNLAFEFSKFFTLGIGFDIQKLNLRLNQSAQPSLALPDFPFKNDLSNWSLGWHIGIFSMPWRGGMYGFSYFSPIDHQLRGTSIFGGPGQFFDRTSSLTGDYRRPADFKFDMFQALNKHFGVLFSTSYVIWSTLQNLVAVNTALPGNPSVTIPFLYHNAWIFTLGGRTVWKRWVFYTIVGYSNSPINNNIRSLFLPENDHWDSTLAVEYHFTKAFAMTLAWKHIYQMRSPINSTVNGVTTTGVAYPSVNSVGIRASYSI